VGEACCWVKMRVLFPYQRVQERG